MGEEPPSFPHGPSTRPVLPRARKRQYPGDIISIWAPIGTFNPSGRKIKTWGTPQIQKDLGPHQGVRGNHYAHILKHNRGPCANHLRHNSPQGGAQLFLSPPFFERLIPAKKWAFPKKRGFYHKHISVVPQSTRKLGGITSKESHQYWGHHKPPGKQGGGYIH